MSATDYGQLTSITREKVMPKVVDEISKGSPVLEALFKAAEQKDGGLYLDIPVKYRHSTKGGSYSGLEPLDSSTEQTRTRVRFQWKQEHQPIILSNIDIAKNGGEGKIVDLMSQEMKEAKIDLRDKFATQIWASYTGGTVTGNSGKDIDTILGAVDDGTNVSLYGDVDRSTHQWFDGNMVDQNGALGLAKMREAFSRASFNGDTPNLIATTPNGGDAYEGLLTATTQFLTNVTNQSSTGEGSVTDLAFRKVRLVTDRYAPSGKMFFLNTNYLKFYTLKHPDYPTDKFGFSMTDLQRPVNQDGKVGYILWYGNLACEEPRKQSVLYNINNAAQY